MSAHVKEPKSPAWKKTFDFPVLNNPSPDRLREFAKSEEVGTSFGAPAYLTRRVSSRSADSTFYVEEGFKVGRFQRAADPAFVAKALEAVRRNLASQDWIQLDRMVGADKDHRVHARLLIPKPFSRVALLWCQTLFPAPKELQDPKRVPDVLSLYFPDWSQGVEGLPARAILVHPEQGINYILGVDYVGEAKMSFLRLAMYQAKKKGGLGLHAGSKILKVRRGGKVQDVGFLLFGLSGTGKTTLTLDDHELRSPEGVEVLQDDIVLMDAQGRAFGTEDNFYVKTEGLKESEQPGLCKALLHEGAVFENVHVDPKSGRIDFLDYSHGTNGRALALRSKIPHTSSRVDLPKTHALVFITRRDTVVPPVARLNHEQAVAFFMLGESIETSAGDPRKAGQPKHEVGFNPFIIGLEDEEGARLHKILLANPDLEVYLLNTGSVGKGSDNGLPTEGKKITKFVSSALLRHIARGDIEWATDPDWGYQVASKAPGVPEFPSFEPRLYYKPETYARLVADLKLERRAWLKQFTALPPQVLKAI